MASIARDPGGRKRLLFVGADGIRKVIRLGKVTEKMALAVKIKVEALAAAKFTRGTVDDEVSRWVADLPDDMHARLAAVGLVEPRAATRSVALGELLTRGSESRTEIKPGTALVHAQARQSLLEYFGGPTSR